MCSSCVTHPLIGYASCCRPRTIALIPLHCSLFKNASNLASSTSLQASLGLTKGFDSVLSPLKSCNTEPQLKGSFTCSHRSCQAAKQSLSHSCSKLASRFSVMLCMSMEELLQTLEHAASRGRVRLQFTIFTLHSLLAPVSVIFAFLQLGQQSACKLKTT